MTSLNEYFRSQQIPLQWSPVLLALAQELSQHAEVEVLHQLFINVGARFATNVESQFHSIKTLPDLADALNELWSKTTWGWVDLKAAADCIEIEHHFSPLSEAFGSDTLEWTVGILEGFYQTVFRTFGASEKMMARCTEQQDDGFCIRIRLAP
jgi:Cellulose synthase subunit D